MKHTARINALAKKVNPGPEIRLFFQQDDGTYVDQHGAPFTQAEFERWCDAEDVHGVAIDFVDSRTAVVFDEAERYL